MHTATVFDANPDTGLIAVEASNGQCAVFVRVAGTRVAVGDVLEGQLTSKNPAMLRCAGHGNSVVVAFGTGQISFREAADIVGHEERELLSSMEVALQ